MRPLTGKLGRPLRFCITPGHIQDITAALPLLEGQNADAILADKAYNSKELRDRIAQMKAQAVIPSKRNRKLFIPHDTKLYKARNRIERCFFNQLKHFRRFATRHDRRTIHFNGFVYLAAAMIWLA